MQTTQETLVKAMDDHRRGNLKEAGEQYQEILRIDPGHCDAAHLLGVTTFQSGRSAEAIQQLERAVELNPNQPEFFNSLAAVFRSQGRLHDAEAACLRSLEINPNYADAHNTLGNVHRDHGLTEAAQACFRRAIAADPNCNAARESLNRLKNHAAENVQPNNATASDFHQKQSNESIPQSHIDLPKSSGISISSDLKSVLHVGCGVKHPELLHKRFHGSDWTEIRLDIDPDVKPDIVASLTNMQGVADATVDAVWSSHNLEHLPAHEVPVALAEFYRVVKPGGMVLISVPDLQQVAEFVVADKLEDVIYVSPAGPIRPLDCLFGFGKAVAEGNDYMAHRTGFTGTTMTNHLKNSGFTEVKVWNAPFNLWAEAWKR